MNKLNIRSFSSNMIHITCLVSVVIFLSSCGLKKTVRHDLIVQSSTATSQKESAEYLNVITQSVASSTTDVGFANAVLRYEITIDSLHYHFSQSGGGLSIYGVKNLSSSLIQNSTSLTTSVDSVISGRQEISSSSSYDNTSHSLDLIGKSVTTRRSPWYVTASRAGLVILLPILIVFIIFKIKSRIYALFRK